MTAFRRRGVFFVRHPARRAASLCAKSAFRSTMKLYSYAPAAYSRKAQLAAYEKAAPAEIVTVVPFDGAAMARLREALRSPLAQIPVLELDDGTVLGESSIIAEHFDLEVRDGPELFDADRRKALEIRAFDRFADVLLSSSGFLSWELRKPTAAQRPEKIAKTKAAYFTAVSSLERHMEGRSFVVHDRFSIADISLSVALMDQSFWDDIAELEQYPSVYRWLRAICERPSWRRVLAESDAAAAVTLPRGGKPPPKTPTA